MTPKHLFSAPRVLAASITSALPSLTIACAVVLAAPGCGDSSGFGGGGDGGVASDDLGDDDPGQVEAGQLTAGEWRDLDHWEFWNGLFTLGSWANMETYWSFYTAQRYAVIVTDDNVPIVDAVVTLRDAEQQVVWKARTDNHGRAELFAGLFDQAVAEGLSLTASSGDAEVTIDDPAVYSGDPVVIELDEAVTPPPVLDLMFMVDTTGSMGDELVYLQSELADVISTVEANAADSVEVRLSVNFYRDVGDAYLVRPFPFTTDIDAALTQLESQDAEGGGDYPEAVETALQNAVVRHAWSESARARLLFFVLDAPPDQGEGVASQLHTATALAAAQGVRVIPIGASGIDKSTEFLLRFIDIATGGTYVFLTDDSGIGNDHLEPTIGEYQVEYLNNLLVRLIGAAIE